MILGRICTRDCRFCHVAGGRPEKPAAREPEQVGEAVRRLALRYVVITSVTRDDLPDGGAGHFARTILAIREASPATAVEVLIPDFQGDENALKTIIAVRPEVISHNVETAPALYAEVRPQAEYRRSLALLRRVKEEAPSIWTKTGLMLGLGETPEQLLAVFDDLRGVGCEFLTLGQYLAPSRAHYPVKAYVSPELFAVYGAMAEEKGFAFVASAPYVRSSYHAGEALGLERA